MSYYFKPDAPWERIHMIGYNDTAWGATIPDRDIPSPHAVETRIRQEKEAREAAEQAKKESEQRRLQNERSTPSSSSQPVTSDVGDSLLQRRIPNDRTYAYALSQPRQANYWHRKPSTIICAPPKRVQPIIHQATHVPRLPRPASSSLPQSTNHCQGSSTNPLPGLDLTNTLRGQPLNNDFGAMLQPLPPPSNISNASLEDIRQNAIRDTQSNLRFLMEQSNNPSRQGTVNNRELFSGRTSQPAPFWNPSLLETRPSSSTHAQPVTFQGKVLSSNRSVNYGESSSSSNPPGFSNAQPATSGLLTKSQPCPAQTIHFEKETKPIISKSLFTRSQPGPAETNNVELRETKPIISKNTPTNSQPGPAQGNNVSRARAVYHEESSSSSSSTSTSKPATTIHLEKETKPIISKSIPTKFQPVAAQTSHVELRETKPIISKSTLTNSQPISAQGDNVPRKRAVQHEESSSSLTPTSRPVNEQAKKPLRKRTLQHEESSCSPTPQPDANNLPESPIKEEIPLISKKGDKNILRSEMIQFFNESMDEIRAMLDTGNYKQAAFATLGNLAYKRDKWLMEIEKENEKNDVEKRNPDEPSTSDSKRNR